MRAGGVVAASLGSAPDRPPGEFQFSTATIDRLLYHAHICQTAGECVRLSQALAEQGVSPFN